MVICIKRSRAVAVMLVLLLFLSTATTVFRNIHHTDAAKTVSAPFEEQQISEKLLVYLFLKEIQEQSNLFYAPYYTVSPTVSYYFTTVTEIQEDGANICITFTSLPYIGPHDAIGEDGVTFCVNHSGEIIDMEFKHLKSYSLPDNLSYLEKGALPPVSK